MKRKRFIENGYKKARRGYYGEKPYTSIDWKKEDSWIFAIEGCVHGELDCCYKAVPPQAQFLIWCGDVQTTKDEQDLESLAVPKKYRAVKDFPFYYFGIKEAPLLTLFVGGNHENSKLLNILSKGGWVAPNIFYLGKANLIHVVKNKRKLCIAGYSGIYKHFDRNKPYVETFPFDDNTIRSVYHTRTFELKKLALVSSKVDVVVSHDWPANVVAASSSNAKRLLEVKPFFKDDIEQKRFGNPDGAILMKALKPRIWTAAHYHVNFSCEVDLDEVEIVNPLLDSSNRDKGDKSLFIACDKPKGNMASVALISYEEFKKEEEELSDLEDGLYFDLEWLLVQRSFSSSSSSNFILPPLEEINCLCKNVKELIPSCSIPTFEETQYSSDNTQFKRLLRNTFIRIPDWNKELDYRQPEKQSDFMEKLFHGMQTTCKLGTCENASQE